MKIHFSLYFVNTPYLLVIRAKDDPAAQTVTQVDDSSTADETDNIWESCPECQDENLKIAIQYCKIYNYIKKSLVAFPLQSQFSEI